MLLLLHNIRSMYNVGSIFRTADALGVEKIFLCGITPTPTDRLGRPRSQLTKVSLGAEQSVAWEKVGRTVDLLEKLTQQGYRILAIEQSKKSVPYFKVKLSSAASKKTVLVVGNEIKGLSPAILQRADKILEIPMRGHKESLNVAVAFGIVAFSLVY